MLRSILEEYGGEDRIVRNYIYLRALGAIDGKYLAARQTIAIWEERAQEILNDGFPMAAPIPHLSEQVGIGEFSPKLRTLISQRLKQMHTIIVHRNVTTGRFDSARWYGTRMASRTLISAEEYLRTSYRPDCDYVDGEVLERNVGEKTHGTVQKKIVLYLAPRETELGICVFPTQRVGVSQTRIRIPDVCVTLGEPAEQIFTKPPFICIEVLSPEDRWARIQQRIDDYLAMGVPYVWVLDRSTETAYTATPSERMQQVTTGVLKTLNPSVELPLREIL